MATRSSILVLTIMSFLVAAPPAAYSEQGGFFRATMTRHEPSINLTRAAHKSRERLSILSSRLLDTASAGGSAQTPLQRDSDGGAYDMTFSMGTPPQQLTALADTGSDLIWAKCGPCKRCAPRGSPSYYPNKSSSFSKLPCSSGLCRSLESQSLATCSGGGASAGAAVCDYKYSYGLSSNPHHYTQGYMASETFTLGGGAAVRGIGFGCTTMSEGGYGSGSGLVGLGRGKLSLVSQLEVGAFSYCLTSDMSMSSPLLFGAGALTGAGVQSTPLLRSSTFYTVNLTSISIGAVNGEARHHLRLRHDADVPCRAGVHARQGGAAVADDEPHKGSGHERLRGLLPDVVRLRRRRVPVHGAALRRRRHGPQVGELLPCGGRQRQLLDRAELAQQRVHHRQHHADGLPHPVRLGKVAGILPAGQLRQSLKN